MNDESTLRSVVFPAPCQQFGNRRGHRASRNQIVHPQRHRAEAPDRQTRSVNRERRDDGVDPRAVGKARVNHRTGFVNPSAHSGHDPIDQREQVLIIIEFHLGGFQHATALDIHLPRRVHQNIGDRSVGQQRLKRPQSGNFMPDVHHNLSSLGCIQLSTVLGQQLIDLATQLLMELFGRLRRQLARIDAIEKFTMDPPFQNPVGGAADRLWRGPGGRGYRVRALRRHPGRTSGFNQTVSD
jgi:hypothetical protein